MSQGNVEIVRRGYEALNSGDIEGALALFDPEVEVEMAEEPGEVALFDLRKTYRGVDGFLEFLSKISEVWGEFRWEPEDFFDAGDDVLVFITLTAKGRGSGAVVDRPIAHLCTMRDRKLIRHKTFWSREDALEAAGLTE